MTGHATTASRDEDHTTGGFDLGELLRDLWAQKWVIGASGAVGMVAMVLIAMFFVTPKYQATATVLLQDQQSRVPSAASSVLAGLAGASGVALPSSTSDAVNEELILKSLDLHRRVVAKLNLTEDPEFNPALANGVDHPRALDLTALNFRNFIGVTNLPSSMVFEISSLTTDPEKSALIANTLAEMYIRDQLEMKFKALEDRATWLSGRVAALETDMTVAQKRLAEFSAQTGVVTPEDLLLEQVQLSELRTRIKEIQEQETERRVRVLRLEEAQPLSIAERVAIAENRDLADLAATFADTPSVEQIAEFDATYNDLLTRARTELRRTQDQLTALRRTEDSMNLRLDDVSGFVAQLEQLTRDVSTTQLIYESFLAQLKETSLQEGNQKPDSRTLSAAIVPFGPASPKLSLFAALGLLGGLFLGTAGVLVYRLLTPGFLNSDDLEQITGLRVLGRIPNIAANGTKRAILRRSRPRLARGALTAFLKQNAMTPTAEAVRNLRTSLTVMERAQQTVLMTSSIPDEGKTTLTVALAHSLAQSGRKVLILEADLRRNVFGEYFAQEKAQLNKAADGIVPSGDLGFDILFATHVPGLDAPGGVDLRALEQKLDDLRKRYDHIIMDAPPVLAVTDSQVMAKIVDAVLFAVCWRSTPRGDVVDALDNLDRAGVRVDGLVLTQIEETDARSYRYSGYLDIAPAGQQA